MRIARTFCFSNEGQALYLSSPTEIQRLTYSQEMCDNLQVGIASLLHTVFVWEGWRPEQRTVQVWIATFAARFLKVAFYQAMISSQK